MELKDFIKEGDTIVIIIDVKNYNSSKTECCRVYNSIQLPLGVTVIDQENLCNLTDWVSAQFEFNTYLDYDHNEFIRYPGVGLAKIIQTYFNFKINVIFTSNKHITRTPIYRKLNPELYGDK